MEAHRISCRKHRPHGGCREQAEDSDELDHETGYDEELTVAEERIGYFVQDLDNDVAEHAAEIVQAEHEAYFVKKGASQKGSHGLDPVSSR